uniref:Transmembrane protein 198 n=1 Tax=Cavia porcellus TaxID=10141 RepID=A0A286XY38_CAVPO
MGPRLRDSPHPCSCSFPFPGPGQSLRTPRDWSASRCWRWSGDTAARRPGSPAQQPPSSPDPIRLEPCAPRHPGPYGPCASFAQKLRSPPAQLLPPEPDDAFWGAPCEQPLERRYQALPALVCIMCCLFGVVYCFFGYRCFKAVLFLTGLL